MPHMPRDSKPSLERAWIVHIFSAMASDARVDGGGSTLAAEDFLTKTRRG